jgi:hypothetical protein
MVGALIAALRPILAVALVGGAATVAVAPALDMAMQQRGSNALSAGAAPLRNHPTPTPNPDEDPTEEPKLDYETLVRMCLDKRDPDSDACAEAALQSGLSYEEFRAKIVAKLEGDKPKDEPKKDEPKPEPKAEPVKKAEPVVVKKTEPTKSSFDTLLAKCLDSRDENSDACIRAGEASGLSAADWSAKIRAKLDAARQGDFAKYFEKCLATKNFDSDECIRAEELSGLSTADFEAKFKAKLAAKEGNDFWTVFEKCLDTRNWRSDTCFRAQELIGFNDADFHSKFDRYLADRDAKTGVKPAVTPKPVTNMDPLFQACGATHEWNSNACIEAFVRSALQPAEFRTKMQAKFGEFH